MLLSTTNSTNDSDSFPILHMQGKASSRPTSLAQALSDSKAQTDSASADSHQVAEFTSAIAAHLVSLAPGEVFSSQATDSSDLSIESLQAISEESGLPQQSKVDAIANVVSGMMVQLIDDAITGLREGGAAQFTEVR